MPDRGPPAADRPAGRARPAGWACLALAVAAGAPAPAPAQGQGREAPLFSSHRQLKATLAADFRALGGDRRDSPDRPAVFTVGGPGEEETRLEIEVRTRGEFRLDPSNCSFPPLRLDFDDAAVGGTELEGQGELKLVSSCRPGRARYDRLVPLEYLAYRAYGLLAEASLRVRPLELTFVDTSGGDAPTTRFAFLVEEDEALAERLGATVFDLEEGRNLPPEAFEPMSRTTTAVFEYMIGNTDWSDVAGQNVEILERAGVAIAVPYDFDFSGLVDAPYASADPDFRLASVRERYYRGWCADPVTVRAVLARFRQVTPEVRALFREEEGLLHPDDRRRALAYLEAFFEEVATDERAERRFLRDCRTLRP